MKKIIILLTLFLTILPINASIDNKENIYTINYTSLNSTHLTYILSNTDSYIVEIEVLLKNKLYTYKFDTYNISNIEKELKEKCIKEINDNNLKVYIKLHGVKITKIKIKCTTTSYNLIKERSKQYE